MRPILPPTTVSHFDQRDTTSGRAYPPAPPAPGSRRDPPNRSVCGDGAAYHHARRFDLYAGPHSGGDGDAVDELALGALRLCLLHRIRESPDVFHQLVGRKRRFANPGMDDTGLLDAELDRAALRGLDGAGDVHRHGADLG